MKVYIYVNMSLIIVAKYKKTKLHILNKIIQNARKERTNKIIKKKIIYLKKQNKNTSK